MTIDAAHLNVHLGSRHIIRDVGFTAPNGKVTGFLGPNGSGKTTTLRAMLDLIPIRSGSLTYNGQSIAQLPRGKDGVSALFEHKGQDGWRRADRHLNMVASAVGADHRAVSAAVERVGLSGDIRRRIRTYSLGMRQRLGLAEILISEPRYILLDEPMNGLDPEGIQWLRRLLTDLAENNKTVLVSSHMLNEAEKFVEHIVLLRQGSVVHHGPASDLHGHGGLEEAYLELSAGEGRERS